MALKLFISIIFSEFEYDRSNGYNCSISLFMTSSEQDAKRQCREDPNCHHFFGSESNGLYFKCIGDYQIVSNWPPTLLYSKRIKH